jgi:uncharacterized membrane protein
MGHQHHHVPGQASIFVQRRLAIALAPFLLATAVGLIVLWPSQPEGEDLGGRRLDPQFHATVVGIDRGACESPGNAAGPSLECSVVEIRLDAGPDEGESFRLQEAGGQNARRLSEGDPVIVARSQQQQDTANDQPYYFIDYQRGTPLIVVTVLFALVVIALSRWRGVTSLLGLAISFLVLLQFVIPAILEGSDPVAVSLVGAAAIMFVALYLAHGVNARTSTAVLGTVASLALTALLAAAFVGAARFTGFSSEEALFLQISAEQINIRGLLLGGIIIGTLGVLDDVTVTQASAVWELHNANPSLGARQLYHAAVRIGRDHIASTVNTLVLAYAGAALPLLLIFTLSNRPLGSVLATEVIAEEIVRTFVGSIGLVASVPITTALTAAAITGGRTRKQAPAEPAHPDEDVPQDHRSRFERDWFGDRGSDKEML